MQIKTNGFVLTLWTLFLPVIFLFIIFIVQVNTSYYRKSELQYLAFQGAQKGFIHVKNELQEVFEQNKASHCNVLEPPSICGSNEVNDFISDSEKAEIIRESHQDVWASVREFIINFDPDKSLEVSNIRIIYPYFQEEKELYCALGMKIILLKGSIEVKSFVSF